LDASSAATAATEVATCLRRVASGDVAALERLFDLVAPRLLRYAFAVTRNRVDAEDAVQAAILKLSRAAAVLPTVRHPWAYLLKIVRNESLRILSRRRPMQSLWEGLIGRTKSVEPLEQAEQEAAIQAALQKLPTEQAEVVVLKIWENLTFQEIADITGESLNTVASRYRYALAKLEQSLRSVAVEVGYVVG
jgi:RNA polymerase sigma-70 factor (ECF subfamily)